MYVKATGRENPVQDSAGRTREAARYACPAHPELRAAVTLILLNTLTPERLGTLRAAACTR